MLSSSLIGRCGQSKIGSLRYLVPIYHSCCFHYPFAETLSMQVYLSYGTLDSYPPWSNAMLSRPSRTYNSAIQARPRYANRPVRTFVNDKEYAEVTIAPKLSWNYLHILRPKQSGKGKLAAKKGVEEQSKGSQDRSIEDVQNSRRIVGSVKWWLVDNRCAEKLPHKHESEFIREALKHCS